MRRPNDPKEPKDPKSADDEQPKPGGHARDRMDLFNRQRGLPTDPDAGDRESGDDKAAPKGKPTQD